MGNQSFNVRDGRIFMCKAMCDIYGNETPAPGIRELAHELPYIDENLVKLVTLALNAGYDAAVDALFGRTADTQTTIEQNRQRT